MYPPPATATLQLEISLNTEPATAWSAPRVRQPRSFVGWTDLFGQLENVLDELRARASDTPLTTQSFAGNVAWQGAVSTLRRNSFDMSADVPSLWKDGDAGNSGVARDFDADNPPTAGRERVEGGACGE